MAAVSNGVVRKPSGSGSQAIRGGYPGLRS